MFDLIIKNGTVIDGTGKDAFSADVGVKNGIIVSVGDLSSEDAVSVVDASGKTVVPGFIDGHSHADITAVRFPELQSLTVQGITTVCAGHCGMGMAPLNSYYMGMLNDQAALDKVFPPLFAGNGLGRVPVVELDAFKKAFYECYGIEIDWNDFGGYLDHLEKNGIGPNMACMVPHGPIRIAVMGRDYERCATADEIKAMCGILKKSMEAGAWGISFGLDYQPGDHADHDEIAALAAVAAEYKGIVTVHAQHSPFRCGKSDPSHQAIDGFREFLDIGFETGAHIHISHLRPGYRGMPHADLQDEACRCVLRLFEEYRKKGVRVTWDVLPEYTDATHFYPMLIHKLMHYVEQCGSMTRFAEMLANSEYRRRLKFELEQGINPGVHDLAGFNIKLPGWENMRMIVKSKNTDHVGKTIGEIAAERGVSPLDAYLDLIHEDPGVCARINIPGDRMGLRVYGTQPDTAYGLDISGCNYDCNEEKRPDMPPKYTGAYTEFGAMIHLLCTVPSERREDLIASVTGRVASNYGFADRGFIKEGMHADIVVLDWEKLDPDFDYVTPNRPPKGVERVYINGVLAAEMGNPVASGFGRVMRRG